MNVFILEDDEVKCSLIQEAVSNFYSGMSVRFFLARNLSEAAKLLYEKRFDLVVLDLMVPLRKSEQPVDITGEILSILNSSEKNVGTAAVALSGFDEIVEEHRREFSDSGVLLIHYGANDNAWVGVLNACLQKFESKLRYDFVVICALNKERDAFRSTAATCLPLKSLAGLDCMPMTIGEFVGVCIKLPRMGLVEASITSARALEIFHPKLIAMSGICAGVAGQSNIGTLVVADMCWEYQAGKWADDGFKIEHYDVGLPSAIRTELSQLAAADPIAASLKSDLTDDPNLIGQPILFQPFATGSAVVASSEKMNAVAEQHRKMAALDMEMYGVYKAADLSARTVEFFGAKVVVDLADNAKGDTYHRYGSVLSARFVAKSIEALLTKQE